MDRYEKMSRDALKEAGAVLKSKNRHEKWELPDGRCIVFSVTPSDVNAWNQKWRDVRSLLGLTGERGVEGERREKKSKGHSRRGVSVLGAGVRGTRTLAEALRAVSVRRKAYSECFPHERIPVYRICLSVWLRKVLR